MAQLLTTTEVARILDVGVSSVKRWTDEDLLDAVKTAGGHRRYTVEALHRFANSLGLDKSRLPALPESRKPLLFAHAEQVRRALIAALDRGDAMKASALIADHVITSDNRARFLDEVIGDTLRLVGEKWSEGKWSVESEHRASYVVADAVDALRPAKKKKGSLAVLACPPGEHHDLPLRMIRLVLEWSGWQTDYLGADVPWESLQRVSAEQKPALLLLTARAAEAFDSDSFGQLVQSSIRSGVVVGIGGEWARGGSQRDDSIVRFRTLAGFDRWLRSRK